MEVKPPRVSHGNEPLEKLPQASTPAAFVVKAKPVFFNRKGEEKFSKIPGFFNRNKNRNIPVFYNRNFRKYPDSLIEKGRLKYPDSLIEKGRLKYPDSLIPRGSGIYPRGVHWS